MIDQFSNRSVTWPIFPMYWSQRWARCLLVRCALGASRLHCWLKHHTVFQMLSSADNTDSWSTSDHDNHAPCITLTKAQMDDCIEMSIISRYTFWFSDSSTISSRAFSPLSWSRHSMYTQPPRLARNMAVLLPRPLFAPVIKKILSDMSSSRSFGSKFLFVAKLYQKN